jgi:hypothetical protein
MGMSRYIYRTVLVYKRCSCFVCTRYAGVDSTAVCCVTWEDWSAATSTLTCKHVTEFHGSE